MLGCGLGCRFISVGFIRGGFWRGRWRKTLFWLALFAGGSGGREGGFGSWFLRSFLLFTAAAAAAGDTLSHRGLLWFQGLIYFDWRVLGRCSRFNLFLTLFLLLLLLFMNWCLLHILLFNSPFFLTFYTSFIFLFLMFICMSLSLSCAFICFFWNSVVSIHQIQIF